MQFSVAFLPRDLNTDNLPDRIVVVVFDVLRATTSITAALAAGIREVRIFRDTACARAAADRFPGPRILCGEEKCLPPKGFDLGNSPRAFSERHANQTAFLSTSNGTRAIIAARSAASVLIGALVNASAVDRLLSESNRATTLLLRRHERPDRSRGRPRRRRRHRRDLATDRRRSSGRPASPEHD